MNLAKDIPFQGEQYTRVSQFNRVTIQIDLPSGSDCKTYTVSTSDGSIVIIVDGRAVPIGKWYYNNHNNIIIVCFDWFYVIIIIFYRWEQFDYYSCTRSTYYSCNPGDHSYCSNLYHYLKVTITCRYIFLQFRLKTPLVSTKFCGL